MRLVVRAFTAERPAWFRPSAIAVGFILAQILEQWLRTGGVVSRATWPK